MTVDDIALTLQKGLGVRGAAHLLSLAGSASAVYAASEGELSGKFGLRSDIARALAAKTAHREAEEELRYMRRRPFTVSNCAMHWWAAWPNSPPERRSSAGSLTG